MFLSRFIIYLCVVIFFIGSCFISKCYASSVSIQYLYTYDLNGNMVAVNKKDLKSNKLIDTKTYKYNVLNEMINFFNTQNQVNYIYNYYPDGRRSNKSTLLDGKHNSIGFLYNHYGILVNEEYFNEGELYCISSDFSGLRLVSAMTNSNDDYIQYSLKDKFTHPISVNLKANDNAVQSYNLSDYGGVYDSSVTTDPKQLDEDLGFELNNEIYGNGFYDQESNLYYMGARYYSPITQRFVAQDSYNLLNRYSYLNGNPVMNYDPNGHNVIQDIMPASKKEWVNLGISTAMIGLLVMSDGAVAGLAVNESIAGAADIASPAIIEGSDTAGLSTLLGGVAEINSSAIQGASGIASEAVLDGAESITEMNSSFMTGRQALAYSVNVIKNEALMFGFGYAKSGKTKAGMTAAGLSGNGEMFMTNLISSWAWVGVNKSAYLNEVLSVQRLPIMRYAILSAEGEAAYMTAQGVAAAYSQDFSLDWKMLASSAGIGIAWDGIAESSLLNLASYGQSGAGTAWGMALNYSNGCITGDGCTLDAAGVDADVNNAMMFGAYFSTMPGSY